MPIGYPRWSPFRVCSNDHAQLTGMPYIFFFKIKNCLNDDLFISCDNRIGKMLHNICISAVAMSLRWATRGPWASCLNQKVWVFFYYKNIMLLVFIGSTSLRHFWWVPSTCICVEIRKIMKEVHQDRIIQNSWWIFSTILKNLIYCESFVLRQFHDMLEKFHCEIRKIFTSS